MAKFLDLSNIEDKNTPNIVLMMDSEKELPMFKSMMAETMDQLFNRIKHGDQEHQDWLENELKEFVKTLTIYK